jgi:hypothetical protein
MVHRNNKSSFFQLLAITVFSSLLFVGVTGVTTAQAIPVGVMNNSLNGFLKTAERCDSGDGATNPTGLGTLQKGGASVVMDVTVERKAAGDVTVDIIVQVFDTSVIPPVLVDTVTLNGMGLERNVRVIDFAVDGDNAANLDAAFQGVIVLTKDLTAIQKSAGRVIYKNEEGSPTPSNQACLGIGKFKAVNLTP